MAPMMRMALVTLLFAFAGVSAYTPADVTADEILAASIPVLATAASKHSLPDFQVSSRGRDESDADGEFLGHGLPAVYKSDGATIITRCTVPGTVALTYDDGPFKYTGRLLDILKAKGVKATFFINGDNNAKLKDYEHIVKRAYKEGHQIASHTWSHKDLGKMSSGQVRKEMTLLDNAIKKLIGVKPVYMRPPFGSLSTTAKRTLGSMNYNVVLWDFDTNDWRHPNDINKSMKPIHSAVDGGKKGAHNILMHDIIEKTATTLTPRAIDHIRSKGYKMVTVGECLGKPKSAWYNMESVDQSLNVHSWLVVITFMIVIAIVIHPIRVPLPIPASFFSRSHSRSCPNQSTGQQQQPQTADAVETSVINSPQKNTVTATATATNSKKLFPYHLTLDIATAPVLGVIFLLATRSIEGNSVRDGIVGAPGSGVEPYAVMILFFSLAYICISLDMTGVFQYAAFWISKRGGGSGQRVFLSFFMLSTVMSGLTSNDVVVLTMTPFLVYYSHAVDLLTPVAFLMAEIQTANIASMALYIGNLTNVVACQAYKISFLEYSAWMLLPCFAAIATCYIMLRINFRHEKYIPKIVKTPNVDPRSCLVDPVGAIFGLSVLACSLICLIGTSFAHVSVWIVTGPFALLTLVRDIWYDSRGNFKPAQVAVTTLSDGQEVEENHESHGGASGNEESRMEKGLPESAVPESSIAIPVSVLPRTSVNGNLRDGKESVETVIISTTLDANTTAPADEGTSTHHQGWSKKLGHKFEQKWPLLHAIAIRMPWAILPFTFSMFIMVEGLSHSGWIGIFAKWATKLVPNYIAATYAIGFISVLLCNIFNNVPMTILVARILQHPNFVNSPLATPEVIKGCLFALIVGSNLGACTTLISSLAGLMWDSVLRSKGSGVGFWSFFRWNMGVMPMVILVTLTVVVIELAVMF
ncbi:hypothetical protein EC991_007580 [Linnemannia zychae]|nr:hypothetical protein EC991_007580 [Linnemannia zychae]